MEIAIKSFKVGILDYGIGNLNSIVNAVERLGHRAEIIAEIDQHSQLSHLIIPGVGAFGSCANKIRDRVSINVLSDLVLGTKIPTLGICVGMQLMCHSSEEDNSVEGLGWFPGKIKKLRSSDEARVPHVGWNEVLFKNNSLGFHQNSSSHFYFDHSYAYVKEQSAEVEAVCDYADGFSAIIRRENIVGVQFHPEKSQKNGAKLLENFFNL